MDAEQDYRLLTFLCGCAAVDPVSNEDPEDFIEAEAYRLGRFRVAEHYMMQRHCDNDDCDGNIGLESRRTVVDRWSRQILGQIRENFIKYTKLGQRYHSCLLRTRAKFANSELCALAHQQFATSSTPRSQDPFFEIDEDTKNLLTAAREGILESDEDEDIDAAMNMTHKALFLCGMKTDAIVWLGFGVDAIVSAEKGLTDGLGGASQLTPRFREKRRHMAEQPQMESAIEELLSTGQESLPPRLSRSLPSKKPEYLATGTGFVEPISQNLHRRKGKMQRNPEYTWPAYRWNLYRPRGLAAKDPSPITSRKLNLRAGVARNNERERLFQKMIYGQWITRMGGSRYGPPVDMYAIWPEA